MKLQYLGTAAAEGIPALFCKCPVCVKARENGGRDIRTRSQALVDGEILLDFPPDTYAHYLNFGFDLPSIQHLFVTHSHSDHFYPDDLILRHPGYGHQDFETLHIYGNERVEELFYMLQLTQREGIDNCRFHLVKPFDRIDAGAYQVTAFPALHNKRETCLFYSLEHEGKALLYVHDSGDLPPAAWDYIASAKPRFDLVSLDCTCVKYPDGKNHMGIPDNIKVRQRLFDVGAADKNTVFVLNHFSLNGGCNHDEFSVLAEKEGFLAAWDGMEITL
jgi:phosphoribosyl 1,2-cyclic phosphate phosphodiesterase